MNGQSNEAAPEMGILGWLHEGESCPPDPVTSDLRTLTQHLGFFKLCSARPSRGGTGDRQPEGFTEEGTELGGWAGGWGVVSEKEGRKQAEEGPTAPDLSGQEGSRDSPQRAGAWLLFEWKQFAHL